LFFTLVGVCHAQVTLGRVEGTVADANGRAVRGRVDVRNASGASVVVETDAHGRYFVAVPYGAYVIYAVPAGGACVVRVLPLETARCDVKEGERATGESGGTPLGAYSAAQDVLFQVPAAVTEPLNFEGVVAIRLPFVAGWAAEWTVAAFHLNGMDATDSYQSGRPVMLDDAAAADAVVSRDGFDVGVYLRWPGSEWHEGLATDDTGSVLAGDNLPRGPDRGAVQVADRLRWFTRDTAQVSGPITRWADIFATGTAQWASQTAPLRPDRTAIDSRELFGNVHGRVRFGRDQIDALYSGSRIDLGSGGWPAGVEAIFASRMMPSFYGVSGFENLRETDHFDLVQAGWTHSFAGKAGVVEARYQYSTAHLDTSAKTGGPVGIDLLDPAPVQVPLSNLAIRTRHEFEGAYHWRHFVFGGGWQEAQPRNRFHVPAVESITAGGQLAYEVVFSAAPETRARIAAFHVSAADSIQLAHGVTVDAGFVVDGARAGPIAWTSPSPRIAVAAPAPGFSRLTFRGNYARTYGRLAGRYLDFGNPQSLSAQVYDATGGTLLQRFGGAFSGIAAGLKRPYADEFNLSAELALPAHSAFSVRLLRRDEKNRIAAVNTGLPASSYQPVRMVDPGPDGLAGTFDDQVMTVYAQSPATLGHDFYLLTNPAGLRELNEALIASAGTRIGLAEVHASFAAMKSFGPTNPGNSVWVNDPGVIGGLYSDPNSLINATGHPYMDRAFIGKFQAAVHAPFGIQVGNIVNYFDGLPFARQLLITGLPQGPFLVNATLRGSPEGGNRAQYGLNWNVRVERSFEFRFGEITAIADVMNVLNNGNKIVESDLTGAQFNSRPALAIEPPRALRLGVRFGF
jgi:hypothetical protein